MLSDGVGRCPGCSATVAREGQEWPEGGVSRRSETEEAGIWVGKKELFPEGPSRQKGQGKVRP